MIMVKRVSMTGMKRGGRSPDEHGVGYYVLQPRRGGKNALQHRTEVCHILIISDK
jgi:hypothetical protein